ncbi:TetR family transcriptional regulator [Streptomyces sp. DSM 44917]|uniref:TetR family transcriptional regulator n=1 Tax=Streptomyces boetiae TaxID=3075541 RepID=A0ABU2L316_9ACTN|nr:TetR family transcriptional regulator [Streptomyces sp. DSM 44917]MDT0305698.1 TetR family transcriptional regulator [Streptomyces sp. DSM 44917]
MSSVKSRREQYSEATRAALLEAATRRFAEDGFAGTSLGGIAADIHATRGAVYHHFASKTALFEAVLEAQETEMVRLVSEAGAHAGTPWEAARAAMEAFLDRSCDPVYGRVVWQEAPLALGWRRWKECEEEYALGLIERLMAALMEHGDIAPLPMEAAARVTFHVLGAAGMALAEAAEADKPRVRAEYSEVIDRLLSGLRSRPAPPAPGPPAPDRA